MIAAAVLIGCLLAAALLIGREARRSGLGVVHPGVPWLALHTVFFGAGGAILAVAEGMTGQALLTGLAALVFACGLAASAAVARRRQQAGASGYRPPPAAGGDDVRRVVVSAAAVAAMLLLVPTFATSGIPFLTTDITGARAELSGLVVQPVRVALPALALVAVLIAASSVAISRRAIAIAVGTVAIAGAFALLLASRYFIAELAGAIAIGWLLRGGRIPGRVLVAVLLVGGVLFAGIGLLRAYGEAQGRELAFVAERTVNRVLLVQPRTLDAIMAAIPANQPFLDGLGWFRRLGPLLGRDIPNLGYWIYPQVVGGAQAVAGYAAPGLIGEAWANFGWLGVALFAGLGVAAERLAALMRLRHGVADRAAAALLVLFIARTHALGLGGLAVLVALTVLWRLAAAPLAGLARDVRSVLAWRVPSG